MRPETELEFDRKISFCLNFAKVETENSYNTEHPFFPEVLEHKLKWFRSVAKFHEERGYVTRKQMAALRGYFTNARSMIRWNKEGENDPNYVHRDFLRQFYWVLEANW